MHLRHAVGARALARRGAALAALLAAVAPLASGDARAADDKEVCIRAAERAQVARLDGKLTSARDGFVTCARPVCPVIVREDCTRWLADVEASVPSIVVDAVWADGRDVTSVTVLLDGRPLAGAEKGRAIPLDPGEHTFRFEAEGAAPVEERNVIREGEKNRILHVVFTPNAAAPAAASGSATTTAAAPPALWQEPAAAEAHPRPSTHSPIPPAAIVLGSVGILSFGGFAYFGLAGTGQLDSMRSTCVHSCNPSDVTAARNEVLLGDILGYIGLAATGAALWLYFTRPEVPDAPSAAAR